MMLMNARDPAVADHCVQIPLVHCKPEQHSPTGLHAPPCSG